MAAPGFNTKQFVDILDVRDNIIVLKNGSLRLVIEVGSVNFDLKSPDEQAAIIEGFKNFLNSLDFPLQIVILSRKLNIADYLIRVGQAVETVNNELLRIQGVEYIRFVQGLVELANAMTKKFYVVIPLYVLESATAAKKGVFESFKLAFGSAKDKIKALNEADFNVYKTQIEQRAELIFDGLQSVGLNSRLLNSEELVNLFTTLYNPEINA